MRSERFGRLLKAAIGSIVAHEGVTAPVIEDELAQQIGRSAASIQRYKAGHIPPEAPVIELLAQAAVRRGYLNAAWLEAFLRAARHANAARVLGQLYPAPVAAQAPAAGPIATNLPAPTYAQFIPRPTAHAELLEGLQARTAVVLLLGIGGAGKSSLAHELASAAVARALPGPAFDAVVWVSDRDHPGRTTLAAVLSEIARTLDHTALLGQGLAERQRAVDTLLRRQRVLLVIDNLETVEDQALLEWLPRLPEPSKALATSRELRRELMRSCWPVELGGLAPMEGRALLRQRLRALRLDEGATGGVFERLLEVTGGNPKALEVALGALKYGTRTPAQLVDEFAAARGAPFDELFARSWDMLGPDARQVLLALALFDAPAEHSALAAVAGAQGGAYAQALELLIDLSLLTRQGAGAAVRFTLHPLVRAFAGARLRGLPDFEREARRRQLDWYITLAEQVGYCWDDLGRLALLDPERATITGLIRWHVAEGQEAALARLVRGVDYYYYIRGLWAEAADLSAVRAALASRAASPDEAALALAYHVQMLCRQGQREAAAAQLPQLVRMAHGHGRSAAVQFEVAYTQALYQMLCGDDERAITLWREALPLAERLSVRPYAVARGWLALCCYRQGMVDEARALWEAVLVDAEAGGFRRGVVSSQAGLARIDLDGGDTGAARERLDHGRRVAAAYGDQEALAELDALDARYHLLRGDGADASAAASRDSGRIGAPAWLSADSARLP
jgi:LuxR family glucitol operon transcriptional activator